MVIVFFVLGLVLLIGGAELLVRGASRLAAALGVAPLIIGLTVVAFGTSAPEFAISLKSTYSGQAGIAIGNVVGSNICNVLLVLGVAAVVAPLVVAQQIVRLEVPLLILSSTVVWLMGLDGQFSRAEGVFLFGALLIYVLFLIRLSRRESLEIQQEYADEFGRKETPDAKFYLRNIALFVIGLTLLIFGSRWMVESAVSLAQQLGLSELIIGLTIIAIGTSLPEVVTSIIASVRGERDIAVGNVMGSNLFNILGVLGLSSLLAPEGVPVSSAAINFDIPIMIAISLACLPIFFTGNKIARWEGALFLAYYAAYVLYLILAATQHETLPMFSTVMLYFVIPITVVTLAILFVSALQNRYRARLLREAQK